MGLRRFLCSCCTTKNRKADPLFSVPTEGDEKETTESEAKAVSGKSSTHAPPAATAAGSAEAAAIGGVGDAEFMKQVLEVADQLVERKIMTQLLGQLTQGPPCSDFVNALAGAMREVYVTPLFLRLRDTVAKGANEQTRKEAEECSTLIANAVIEATLKKTPFYDATVAVGGGETGATISEVAEVVASTDVAGESTGPRRIGSKETAAAQKTKVAKETTVAPAEASLGAETPAIDATRASEAPSKKEEVAAGEGDDEADWTDEEGVKVEEAVISPRRDSKTDTPQILDTADSSSESSEDASSTISSSLDAPVDAEAVQSAVNSVITSLGGRVSPSV